MPNTANVQVTMMDKQKQRSTVSLDLKLNWAQEMVALLTPTKHADLRKLMEKYSYAKSIRSAQTNADIQRIPTEKDFAAIIATPVMGFDLVDQKAVMLFRSSKSGKVMRMSLPAPHKDIFKYEGGEKGGLRVLEAIGDYFAEELKKILQIELEFLRGYHTGKA